MMANIYGVVAGHAAHRKGYRDFVHHTGLINPDQFHQDVISHFGVTN